MRSIPFELLLTLSLFLRSLQFGTAGITSSFIRTEWPSVDIPLDNEVFAVPKGQNAPQQVHITQGDYDGKAVIISWVTVEEPGDSKVSYGTSQDNYKNQAVGNFTSYAFYNYKSGYIHHCLVEGLEFNTKYYYKIGSGDSGREFWFQTPPAVDPDAAYTFGIIGDLGQTYNSLSTLDHYIRSGGQAVLFVGDLSYADRYDHENGVRWDSWGRFIERSAAYQPWIWTAGNHEIEVNLFLSNHTYTDIQLLSRLAAAVLLFGIPSDVHLPISLYYPATLHMKIGGGRAWTVESVNWEPKQINYEFVHQSMMKYTPQWHWLRDELPRVDREKTPWLIVLMHVPIYNSNEAHYMEGESMRSIFESWFVHFKVDLVFAGHVHAYERSYRISNINYNITSGDCYPIPDKSAPVYITVGDGGNQEGLAGKFTNPQPDYSAYREASYGHSTLEIKNRTHAFYNWIRNDDGKRVPTETVIFHNQYWASNLQRRRLKKHHYESVVPGIATI